MNEPMVRFPEFKEPWKEVKVKDTATNFIGGGTPKTTNEEFWGHGFPWIQSSDLTEHSFKVSPQKEITEKGLESSPAKMIPENSIAIVTRVGVGKIALMPYEYSTSQDFLNLSGLKYDPVFLTYAIYKILQKDKETVQGTAIKGITKDDLLNKEIHVPESRDEQRKIGATLLLVDSLIEEKEKEIENLKKLKRGLIQSLL